MNIDALLADKWFVLGFVLWGTGLIFVGLGSFNLGIETTIRSAFLGVMLGIIPGIWLTAVSFKRNPVFIF